MGLPGRIVIAGDDDGRDTGLDGQTVELLPGSGDDRVQRADLVEEVAGVDAEVGVE